ncbi:MAG: hypothetical protein ACM3XZ_08955 [Betaproteobacteria bacterium]
MRPRRSMIAVLVLFLVSSVGGAASAAITLPVVTPADLGARAMGMGGAYVALADDASAVYWNPAGLAEVKWVSVTPVVGIATSGYQSLKDFADLMETKVNYTDLNIPTKDFNLGASASGLAGIVTKRFGVSYMPSASVSFGYDFDEPAPHSNTAIQARATVYQDTVLSAALPLAKAPFNLAGLNVGANLKFIKGEYYSADAKLVENQKPELTLGATGNGVALDVGAQAQVSERLRLGLVARDVYRRVDWSAADHPEDGRPTIQAGVAFKAPLGLTLAADVENGRFDGKDVTRWRFGLEESLFGVLAVRGGYRTNPEGKPTLSVGVGAGIGRWLRLEAALASDLADRAEGVLTGILQF